MMNPNQGSNEIKVGALFPLSGELAPVGTSIQRALQFAQDIVNKEFDLSLPLAKTNGLPLLGNRKIKLVFADTQGVPEKGRMEAERLIKQQKVVALIGAYQSSVTAVASLLAEVEKIPFVNPDSSAPSLTKRNFRWFFRIGPDDQLFTNLHFQLFHYLRKWGEEFSRFAIISENSEFGRETSATKIDSVRRFNAEVVDIEMYHQPTASLKALIKRIQTKNSQVVFGQQVLTDAIAVVQALKALNWFPDGWLAQGAGYLAPEFLKAIGEDANYIISPATWAVGLGKSKPLVAKVNELYRSKFKEDMNDTNTRSFTAFFVLADAINRAGSLNPEAIRTALKNTRIPGEQLIMPWKGVRFNRKGENVWADGLLVQILEGKYQIIWPLTLSETHVIWPAPPWDDRD